MKLATVIRQVIEERLRDAPALLWYDESGTLEPVMGDAVPQGIIRLPFEGSFLALRLQLEEALEQAMARSGMAFQERWFVYIPRRPPEPSWLRDWECFGVRLDWDLERLLAEKLGLPSDAETRTMLAGENGRLLASRWDAVMRSARPPLKKSDLIEGLLTVAANSPGPFDFRRVVLEVLKSAVLSGGEVWKRLERMGLACSFRKLLETQAGLKGLPKDRDALALRLAAAALFSELVERSGGQGAVELAELLPAPEARSWWVALTDEWMRHADYVEAFVFWSKALEARYGVGEKIAGLRELLEVQAFACVDDALLRELTSRVGPEGTHLEEHLVTIKEVAERRLQSFWAKHGEVQLWEAVAIAAELFQEVKRALETLQGLPSPSVQELVNRYGAEEGWWRLDDLALRLTVAAQSVSDEVLIRFVQPAYRRYRDWLDRIMEAFATAVASQGAWEVEGLLNHEAFWEQVVGMGREKVAVFYLDALRLDLARQLKKRLMGRGYQVTERPMRAVLPTVTEVGMAALLPRRSEALTVKVENGQLHAYINGHRVTFRNERKAWLRRFLGDRVEILDLNEVLAPGLAEQLKGKRVVVIMSDELDTLGTFVVDITPGGLLEALGRVMTVAERLREAGFSRLVVGTDHGFVLVPPGVTLETRAAIPPSPDVAVGRRYAVGLPPQREGCVVLPWGEGGKALVPKGLSSFARPGERPIFLHGGLSLQESLVLALEGHAPKRIRKVNVALQIPMPITSVIFFVMLVPTPETLFDTPRRLKVEVLSGGVKIGGSSEVEVSHEERRERVQLQTDLIKGAPESVTVRLIDVETGEVHWGPEEVPMRLLW